jgi:hypothetical protein
VAARVFMTNQSDQILILVLFCLQFCFGKIPSESPLNNYVAIFVSTCWRREVFVVDSRSKHVSIAAGMTAVAMRSQIHPLLSISLYLLAESIAFGHQRQRPRSVEAIL